MKKTMILMSHFSIADSIIILLCVLCNREGEYGGLCKNIVYAQYMCANTSYFRMSASKNRLESRNPLHLCSVCFASFSNR